MSILGSVGPVGTLAPEITKKAANLNLSRLARLESTPRILKKFSRLFLFREKSCLACLELRGHSTQYRHFRSRTALPGLVYLYSLVQTEISTDDTNATNNRGLRDKYGIPTAC